MCRSKAEGGQRCYAHAAQTLTRAENNYKSAYEKAVRAQETDSPLANGFKNMSVNAYGKLAEARAIYASTPQGEADLRARLARLNEDSAQAGELRDAIEKGLLLRERNTAIKTAVKPKKSIPPAARRAEPKATTSTPISRPAGEATPVAAVATARLTDNGIGVTAGDVNVEIPDQYAPSIARLLRMPANQTATLTFPTVDGRTVTITRATTSSGKGKAPATLSIAGRRARLEGPAAHALAEQLDAAYAEADAA